MQTLVTPRRNCRKTDESDDSKTTAASIRRLSSAMQIISTNLYDGDRKIEVKDLLRPGVPANNKKPVQRATLLN